MQIEEYRFGGYSWIDFNESPQTPRQLELYYAALSAQERALFERVCAGLPAAEKLAEIAREKIPLPRSILEQMKIFVPQKLPEPVKYFIKPWCCYENSFALAEGKGLIYVEGLAANPAGIDLHAWVSTDGTDVIDLTWPCQHLNRYFGLVLDTKEVMVKIGTPGGFLDHYLP